jgi:hypothetical protein
MGNYDIVINDVLSGGITGYSAGQFNGDNLIISSTGGAVIISGERGISLTGNATQWDDLRISAEQVRTQGATNIPAWAEWKTNLWALQFTNNDAVFFTCQLPHGYVAGTDISPHIHFIPNGIATTGMVTFTLDYAWLNIGGTYSSTLSVSGSKMVYGDVDKHLILELGEIGGTGDDGADRSFSSMLVCRLYRMDTGFETPLYSRKINFLEFDFHYQSSSFGTNWEYSNESDVALE